MVDRRRKALILSRVFVPTRQKSVQESKGNPRIRQDLPPHLLSSSGSQSPMASLSREGSRAPSLSSNAPLAPVNPLTPTPTLVDDPSQIPPSPPLTASSSITGNTGNKVFEAFTNDPDGPRTFFVATTTNKYMTECFIKVSRG